MMEPTEIEKHILACLTEELKTANAEISNRLQMQDKGVGTAFLLVSALTGALIGLSRQGTFDLIHSELALLVPATAIIVSLFAFRHMDHDAAIAACARYVNLRIRPRFREILGSDVLMWEDFVYEDRLSRTRLAGGASILGNALALLTALNIILMGFSIGIFVIPGHGGSAAQTFDALFWISAAFLLFSMVMFGFIVHTYTRIRDPLTAAGFQKS